VIERATFLTIWSQKRQGSLPKAARFSFHLHFRVGACPVTADDLDLWMSFEPDGQGLGLAIGQQIDHLVSL
jgi:hypothetical protein